MLHSDNVISPLQAHDIDKHTQLNDLQESYETESWPKTATHVDAMIWSPSDVCDQKKNKVCEHLHSQTCRCFAPDWQCIGALGLCQRPQSISTSAAYLWQDSKEDILATRLQKPLLDAV